ncbi:MAG: MFS transporter [Pseudomonadota bacterium]
MEETSGFQARENRRIIVSVILGNTIAWADFALYAYFSPILSKVFFPFAGYYTGLLLYFAIFAISFVFRPLGAVISGAFADRHGRKNTLLATVILSSLCTAAIGVMPGYDTIGVVSIVLLFAIRIGQTMAISAEPTNSTALLIEFNPDDSRRGLISSSVMSGVFLGFLLGILSFFLITTRLSDAQIESWGWRIPFLSFLVIGAIVALLLSTIDESPVFLAHKKEKKLVKAPLKQSLTGQTRLLFTSFGYGIMMAMGNYFVLGFLPSFLTHEIKLTLEEANLAIVFCLLVATILIPVCGYISDKVGRRPVMAAGAILFILLSYPIFYLIETGSLINVIIACIIYGIALAPTASILTTAIAEMFPFATRCTGGAIGYNAALTIAGGLTPIICQWIYHLTGSIYSLDYYITSLALVHLLFVLFSKETKNNSVR